MALTLDPQMTSDVELRLLAIEEGMSDTWRLMRNVVNKEQFNRLNVIRQQELEALETRMDLIEAQIAQLQTLYNDLL